MDLYSFDDIKESVSITRYVSDHGAKITGNRFAAWWRNSSDNNCAISKDDKSYYDHAKQQGGSVLDLAVQAEGFRSTFGASTALGARYNIAPKASTKVEAPTKSDPLNRYGQLLFDGYKKTAEYKYTDEEGKELYSVIRLENKEDGKKTFLQKSTDHWGLEHVRRVLYNLPNVIKSDTVFIVEGEKDADTLNNLGLCATTNNDGAKNWMSDFNRFLQAKNVIILRDNDEAGLEHAKIVTREINDFVSSLKVLCPSKIEKGDVTDYLTKEKGTKEKLLEMVAKAKFVDRKTTSVEEANYSIETARKLNAIPFRNYYESEERDNLGKVKLVEHPLKMTELIEDCRSRFLDFPRRIGSSLFDRDLKTGEVSYIQSTDALVAWIGIKSKQPVEWSRAKGTVTQSQLYQGLMQSVIAYDGMAKAPHYPLRKEVFYIGRPLPQVGDTCEHLDKLVEFFNPAKEIYSALIKSFILAPMFYGNSTPRPAWIIDSVDGKGVGKTTLVKLICHLYEEAPIDIDLSSIKRDMGALTKRLVSADGRSKRIALLDNVQGTLKSQSLAYLITAPSISGMAPYGHGEETRANDITYVITSNAASLDDDIAKRSFIIKLKHPTRTAGWEHSVRSFINANREKIFAEAIHLMQHSNLKLESPKTRYPEFEQTVMLAACGSIERYKELIKTISCDRDESNDTEEIAQTIVSVFSDSIAQAVRENAGCKVSNDSFLSSSAVSMIVANSRTLIMSGITKTTIYEMAQSGNLEQFSGRVRKRIGNKVMRGVYFYAQTGEATTYVNIIDAKRDAVVCLGASQNE